MRTSISRIPSVVLEGAREVLGFRETGFYVELSVGRSKGRRTRVRE